MHRPLTKRISLFFLSDSFQCLCCLLSFFSFLSISPDTRVPHTKGKWSLSSVQNLPRVFFSQKKDNGIPAALPQWSRSLIACFSYWCHSDPPQFVLLQRWFPKLIIAETLSVISTTVTVCDLHAVPCWYTLPFWKQPKLTHIQTVSYFLVALFSVQPIHFFSLYTWHLGSTNDSISDLAEVHHDDFRSFFQFFMIIWNCNPSKDLQVGNACKPITRFSVLTSRSYRIQKDPEKLSIKTAHPLDSWAGVCFLGNYVPFVILVWLIFP